MDDDFWGDFAIDYSGGTDSLFDFSIDPSTLGGLDLSGINLDIPYVDLGDTGTLLGGIDLSNIDLGGAGIDLGGATIAPDGSVMSSKYVDEQGYERNPDGSMTGKTIEDIVGKENVTVPVGRTPIAPNTYKVTYDDGSTQTIRTNPDGTEQVIDTTVATDVPPPGGEIVPSGTGRGGPAPSGGGTSGTTGGITPKDIKSVIDRFTGSSGNTALLTALLGGILGLLGKNSYPKGPVGYQGGIPKYKSTRGEAMSPTAGGRRPGGANIPSLTGGYTLTKAAGGGLMDLAGGGETARYLRGGTDGMADKLQTSIDGKQPARLSHGEFVIPADVVSHLGNGNSDAGADVLYEMMAKVRKARTGNSKQGKQINPRKYTPA